MKTMNLSFGFSSVQSGVRNANAEPQVIAVSTEGGFRITPAVSKALNLQAGDYVMFLSNATDVQKAIDAKVPELVAAVEEAGLAWGSPEAVAYIHTSLDQWAIAKGVQEFTDKGVAKTCKERLSQKDKVAIANQNFDAMMEGLMASDNAEAIEAVSREGITREEQLDILANFVEAKELTKYRGSKTANTAGLTGTGVALNFTDSNIWKQIKSDLGEDATKKNRVFNVELDKMQTAQVDNGYEVVNVAILPLMEYVDEDPARIVKNA